MSEVTDSDVDRILHAGFAQMPEPEVSNDFNSRVRASLRRPESSIGWFAAGLRWVLAPAACSLAATLALMMTFGADRPAPSALAARNLPRRSINVSMDRFRTADFDLDRLDRETPTMYGFRPSMQPSDVKPVRRTVPPAPHGSSGSRYDPRGAGAV